MHIKIKHIIWITCYISFSIQVETCLHGNDCPADKPYCTPVGCTFECPKQSYIDGTNCVQTCGAKFVFNNTCFERCPESVQYVEEEIVLLNNFTVIRNCRQECPDGKFVYNETCVPTCPEIASFVEDGVCTSSCSNRKSVYRDILKNGLIVAKECLQKCDVTSQHPFQEGLNCVSKCDNSNYVSDQVCVLECPIASSIVFNLSICVMSRMCKVSWPEQNYCTKLCPTATFLYNSTCIKTCPTDAKYGFNEKCLPSCPESYPFKCRESYQHCLNGDINHECYFNSCCKACPAEMKTDMENSACVTNCGRLLKTYDNTCVTECPIGSYISSTDSSKCFKICDKLMLGDTCVDECPNYVFNKTCVDICPMSYSMIHEKQCVAECPTPLCAPLQGQECSQSCVYEPISKSWLSSCPLDVPYVFNNETRNVCLKLCPDGQIEDGFKCILAKECERAVLTQGQCLDSCPVGYLFLDTQVSTYSREIDEDNDPCVSSTFAWAYVALLGFSMIVYGILMLLYFCPGIIFRKEKHPAFEQVEENVHVDDTAFIDDSDKDAIIMHEIVHT